ncbi:cytochrome c peroxidase [Olivibacter sp. CPCC 100613]|uniref:cytochrome-c peroxidase n=1 Tax=Olivibacter sp. CPCC 100613 TaxID=3079931 RepID=UPI002FF99AE1
MISRYLILAIIFITTTSLVILCIPTTKSPAISCKDYATIEIERLAAMINDTLLPLAQQEQDIAAMKASFLASRQQFKKIEYYIDYFFPTTVKAINGPPIAEIELGENMIEPPSGFQVIEDYLYNNLDKSSHEALINEIKKLNVSLKRILQYQKTYTITDAQIFDALRLEIFRITALGITGFDAPLSLQSLPEAAASLTGLKQSLHFYPKNEETLTLIDHSINYLRRYNNFNHFDRLTFITAYLNPLSESLKDMRKKLKIPTASSLSALQNDATSLFGADQLDINKFVGNKTAYFSAEKAALGSALFNDIRLSNGNKKSCASCHHADKAFTDGLIKAVGIDRNNLLRNTPTLRYAGFQRAFFYDHKAGTLEDQALDVVHNKEEMKGTLTTTAASLQLDSTFVTLFDRAYGTASGDINPWKIQHALATYIRSLAPFTSKFDQYMAGDDKQLGDAEKKGFNLFMGKAKCATCHFVPIFNGSPAPLFDKTEAEVLGVPAHPDTLQATLDNDKGRYLLNPYEQYAYAFKTPTLRNIAQTAPYMHNGVYQTLEEVMDFYNRGGGAGIGIHLENQTLSDQKLNLSKQEIRDIIAFMQTLSDE